MTRLAELLSVKTFALVCAAILALPAGAQAQAGPGGGGMNNAQDLQQVVNQLDLTPDQQTKVKGIIQQLRTDVRGEMQGIQDAEQDERRTKMQNVQKMIADARDKVEAELTPEQKTKYYPLSATNSLKKTTDLVAALKSESAKSEITDDEKKKLITVLDDSSKTLDGYKTDAAAVTDSAGATDFLKRMMKFQADFRRDVVDALGEDDARKLMQSARQSMRQTAGGRGGADAAPATEPAAK